MPSDQKGRPASPHAHEAVAIRHASVADAAALGELAARTFYDAFADQNTPEDMAAHIAHTYAAERLEVEIEDPATTYLLAFVSPDRPPVGYAKLLAGSTGDAVPGAAQIELCRLYVAQGLQRIGVGSGLMRACLDEASGRQCDTIWLGVWEYNQKAIAFYRRWGFEQVGTQVFRLGSDDQTDLVMAKQIG